MYFVKKNTQLILELSFSIPGTSAALHRQFFLSQMLRVPTKNSRFLVETVKAVTVRKNTFRGTFLQRLLHLDFKQEILSSTKYKTSAQDGRTTASTSTGN
jgi:hypothetical protein